MTFITHGFRVSVVSDVRERVRDIWSPLRFMLRSTLVECVSVLHGTCLKCADFFLSISMCSHVCQQILSTHFSNNMKPARPWMLANLKIIWQFHAHPVHQKVSRFFGPRYIGDDFLLGPNLVSFNRTVVPYEISKVNFRVETKILVSMSEEI